MNTDDQQQQQQYGSRPVPDPTVLTTQQLVGAIGELRETIAAAVRHIDTKIVALKDVHEEKFKSIEKQFTERDVRTEQTSRDSKIAIDAALQAAKEAVAKSEVATIKQIDQQGSLIDTTRNGLSDKIEDVKSRLTLIEGKGTGVAAGWGALLGAVGLIGTLVGIGTLILSRG